MNNNTPAVAHRFESFLQQKGIIPKTIERHKREVLKYENWLLMTADKLPENATKKDLLAYLKHLKEARSLQNATQNQLLQILKNYYAFLAQENGINNITTVIKIRGIKRKHLRPIFSTEELDLLVDAYYYHTKEYTPTVKELRFNPQFDTILQGRYLALTLVCYQGLQTSEILALTAENFDLRKATVTVNQSLKGSARTLALQAVQIGALISYFEQNDNPKLIPNINQFERLNKTLKTLYPKYQDFTQIRASKITHWIKIYGLRKAQHLAGHKNIQSTERHLSGDFETLQNDFENFHPLR